MVIIISRLFVVVVVATLPSSFVTLAAETTKLRVVIFIFIFWKYDDFARSEDIKRVAREFNKDEDGKQKDAFIVLFAFITCKLCARDESDDLRYTFWGKVSRKKTRTKRLFSALYILLSRDEQLRRERQKQRQKQQQRFSWFSLYFEKRFCPTTTERGEKTLRRKKISLTARDDDDDDVLLRVVVVFVKFLILER